VILTEKAKTKQTKKRKKINLMEQQQKKKSKKSYILKYKKECEVERYL
jgi:hypothetical protein